jgi:phage repressor protein C with HTH and peptisase S24 domain
MRNEGERYQFVQERSGLAKAAFAESFGISHSHGHLLATGKLKPPREVLERLQTIYKVNLNWFISGQGLFDLEAYGAVIELLDLEVTTGPGRELEDYAEKQTLKVPISLVAPHRPGKLSAVYIAGDSMVDEKIFDGDIVILSPGQVQGNGICVVSVRSTLLVKLVDFDDNSQSIDLISANPAYPIRHFAGSDLQNLRIEGKVIACVHRM